MLRAVTRRGLFRAAGGGVAAVASFQALPALADTGIEPNTIKRRGVGLRGHDPTRAFKGFTLFAPTTATNKTVYLIDMDGQVFHTWSMPYPPGSYGYLTPRGTLFYNGKIPNATHLGQAPYQGGVALEVDWNGNVLWEVLQPNHHHDGVRLRNGNVLFLCGRPLPQEIARKVRGGLAGTEYDDGQIDSDYLVEMTTDGKVVWEWRAWDHLDPVEDAIPAPQDLRAEWTHANGISEMPDGNILLSMRNISTVVMINRQTGQIYWKLGAPPLAGQHAPYLLENGHILLFDNGPHRVDETLPHSRVLEIDPATKQIVWKYQDAVLAAFYSPRISNAQRLPNGNTLVNEGSFGRIFEVTPEGAVVWEYVNPYFGPGRTSAQARPESMVNNVFRAYRYSPEEIAQAQRAT